MNESGDDVCDRHVPGGNDWGDYDRDRGARVHSYTYGVPGSGRRSTAGP